jgi:hypothetical protein
METGIERYWREQAEDQQRAIMRGYQNAFTSMFAGKQAPSSLLGTIGYKPVEYGVSEWERTLGAIFGGLF